MLIGQAVGTIAAMAVESGVPPRELRPIAVQAVLLDSGSTLIQRWHQDVPWGTDLWEAVQVMCLYQIMDRPGPMRRKSMEFVPLERWGADTPLLVSEVRAALTRLEELTSKPISSLEEMVHLADGDRITPAQLTAVLRSIGPDVPGYITQTIHEEQEYVTDGEFAIIVKHILTGDIAGLGAVSGEGVSEGLSHARNHDTRSTP